MKCLLQFTTPQLEKIHSGKVRDSIKIDNNRRMIVVTDRISAFDDVLKTPIQHKGAVLNAISNFWFEKTKQIIDNHFIESIDPNIILVKECIPIRVEMIVRAYLTGSMWRGYQKGKREFSGVRVPDGMQKNEKFPCPILTPTTKAKIDVEISPKNTIEQGLVDSKIYEQMENISLKLFNMGTKILAEKGIILVDTKYEFGLYDGKLMLIDEIHTPDSSRFWYIKDYENNSQSLEQIDKEYVRQWLLKNKKNGQYPNILPENVIRETTKRYLEIYKKILEKNFEINKNCDIKNRVYRNLVKKGFIKDGYIAIIMGSPSDLEHCKKIQNFIEKYNVMTDLRVVSAHKNGEEIMNMTKEYNYSIEPGAIIAVAGRSNGLGGALAFNMNIPVFNCPPFKDTSDIMVNINSSLIMPSKTPAATVIHPDNVAYAALRSLNINRLREIFNDEIFKIKSSLKEEDKKIRGKI